VLDAGTLAGVLIAAVEADADAREVWRAKGSAYFQQRSRKLPDALAATAKVQAKLVQARRRVEAAQRRTDTRGWVVARRERTRHLIELGGLVQKAGLVELTDDDRATLWRDARSGRASGGTTPATSWRCGSGAANVRSGGSGRWRIGWR
jgi:hypothetical protein